MRAASGPDLDMIFEKATSDLLMSEDIEPLSIDSRCHLIGRIVDHLRHRGRPDYGGLVSASLRRLTKSFPVSDAYYEWCDTRRHRLLTRLKEPRNRDILDVARNWETASLSKRKAALMKSTRLHQSVYLNGIADTVPFSYLFFENPFRSSGMKLTMLFGTFASNIQKGTGLITQFTHRDVGFDDVAEAFDTAHHEMTHGIHFTLGLSRHRNRLHTAHPLYQDARYFEALSTRNADVPALFFEPYAAQTHEVLAHWEGDRISRVVVELARG